ncbi:MAG: hypothetical protein AAGA86_07445 [Bacteroidota bacterium]
MRTFLLITILFIVTKGSTQDMNSERLGTLIASVTDSVEAQGNAFRFVYKDVFILTIYDENANRMRIISPIVPRAELEEEELLNALVANFHSVLDVKYALSDEIIWSVFAHPLKELSEHQVLDAIDQVYLANATFGTTYSSTHLVFPGNTEKKEVPEHKQRIERY